MVVACFAVLIIAAIPLTILELRFDCRENTWYPNLLSNDTIKGGEFSSCLSGVTITSKDDRLLYSSISAYIISCENLHVYREHVQEIDTIPELKDKHLPMYDSSVNSSYFANGFSGQISVRVKAPEAANVSICWFTNENDYEHFLSIGLEDIKQFVAPRDKDKGCINVLEFYNGTEFNTTMIKNILSSYYFIGIRIEKEITSLWYNFTAERSYYNRSDFGKVPDCKISHTDPHCDIHLSDKTCVMLYADPEPVANTSTFHPLALNGQKEPQKLKYGAFIAVCALLSISFLVAMGILVRSVCKKKV